MATEAAAEKKRIKGSVVAGIVAVALVGIYALAGFVIIPRVAESVLPEKLSAALNRRVRVGEVALNPFKLTVAVRGLEIDDKDGKPFASVDEIAADAELAPALTGTWTLSHLRIAKPQVRILKNRDGTFNFSDMAGQKADAKGAEAQPESENKPMMFRVRHLEIASGAVTFEDKSPAVPFTTRAAPIAISVENLTTLPGEVTGYRLGLSTDALERLDIKGTARISETKAQTDLALAGLDLKKFAAYLKDAVGFDLTAGTLSLTAKASFGGATGEPDDLKLSAGTRLNGLVLTDRQSGKPVVELDSLAVEGAEADLAASTLDIGAIETSGLRVWTLVDPDGGTSLDRLAPPADQSAKTDPPRQKADPPAPDRPWKAFLGRFVLSEFALSAKGLTHDGADVGKDGFSPVASLSRLAVEKIALDTAQRLFQVARIETRGGAVHVDRSADGRINLTRLAGQKATQESPPVAAAPADDAAQSPPWLAQVADIVLEDWRVTAVDRVPEDAVSLNLSKIGLRVTDFATKADHRFGLSLGMDINDTGSLSVEGRLGIAPVAADLKVQTQGIDIRPVQPYLADKVNILITGGALENKGRVTLGQTAQGETAVGYTGEAAIVSFASVDRDHTLDMVKWKSLYLSAMDIHTAPVRVAIGQVALTDFFTRVIVNEDGSLNLTRALAGGSTEPGQAEPEPPPANPPEPEKEAPAAQQPEIKIDTVTLQGGRVRFSDRQIQPNFETEFMDLGGSVSGLSSENLARADVLLEGRLDNHAPLKITGKINPLSEDRFTDIKIAFSDIEMSPFTPYSGKYLGYVLDKGKLSLDLSYRLSKRHLEAENRVRFNQLTLGDRVESPDATSLPIGLALSLLEDRDGVIDLDLPVRGNLDDPEFSVGGIVLKMLVNLVKKIITAPFAALGSLFGGGEEMGQVDFAAGASVLAPEQHERLDKLAEALYQRPGLKLDIQGEVAAEKDGEGLRQRRFDELLVAAKIQDRVKKNLPVQPREEMAVSDAEYESYLAAAYAAADFPKPREADGRIKELPLEEMEKLLMTNIHVTENDLRQIAAERAATVKDYLLGTGKVAPERVFLKEPASVTEKKDEAGEEKESRVVFSLK